MLLRAYAVSLKTRRRNSRIVFRFCREFSCKIAEKIIERKQTYRKIIYVMKKKLFLLFACSSMALCGCAQNNEGDSSAASSAESAYSLPTDYASSVKSYLLALKNIRNYSLSEIVSSSSSSTSNFIQSYYTESAFYYSFGDNSYGYILSKDGVYGVSKKGKTIVGGELLKDEDDKVYTSIWDQGLFTGFSSFDEEQIGSMDDGTNVAIKGKKNKIALLNMLGLSTDYYASISSLTGSITKSGKLSIVMKVAYSSTANVKIEATIDGLLSTSIPEIDEYLSSGGSYFTPSESLSKARDLMYGNNYTHFYYEDERKVGVEYFNENYYFVNWDSAYSASSSSILVSQGLIGIDHKKDPSSGASLNGSYLITYNGKELQVSLSVPYNESPNIPYVYHYPSYLALWNDLVYLEEDVIPSDMDEYYSTDDEYLISDFLSNFSLDGSLSSSSIDKLYFGYSDIDNTNNSRTIRFALENSSGSVTYDFTNFGETKIVSLDNFLSSLVDE